MPITRKMSVLTLQPMRAALPRVAVPARPRLSLQVPLFSGLKLSSGIPTMFSGALACTNPGTPLPPLSCTTQHLLPAFHTLAESSCNGLAAPDNGSRVFAMRHGVKKDRLGRPADQRKALIRGLVTEVLRHGKITTTKASSQGTGDEPHRQDGRRPRCSLRATLAAELVEPPRSGRHASAERAVSPRPFVLPLALVFPLSRAPRLPATQTRAMAIRKHVDKMIGLAKKGTLHCRRQVTGCSGVADTVPAGLWACGRSAVVWPRGPGSAGPLRRRPQRSLSSPQAAGFVYDPEIVKSLFEQAPERYSDRSGGYCRVKTEIQRRRGDNTEMAVIELV